MTADGEQTRQDAERTNDRAKSLGQFVKGILQAAEGTGKKTKKYANRFSKKLKDGGEDGLRDSEEEFIH